ncbi:hypothetical protein BOX15_Mlig003806g1 [Macrostomum lignano]|uniref:SANT domain-containing protein n=1 Tax=Macrostomum lignano TaxID=282301 RepID=A0A267G8V7_9PLAT|nr:hypothetical protein BOX15_Mlig003806g1 [Macrostomum lignano]
MGTENSKVMHHSQHHPEAAGAAGGAAPPVVTTAGAVAALHGVSASAAHHHHHHPPPPPQQQHHPPPPPPSQPLPSGARPSTLHVKGPPAQQQHHHHHHPAAMGAAAASSTSGTVPGYATTMITPDTPKKDRVPDPYRYAMDRRQSDKPRIQLIQQRHDPPGAGRQKGELYHPQVEAISPAPEDARNEQKLQKEKNDVGQKLINIESEIKSTVDQLAAKTSELEKLQLKARQGETEEGRRREEEELAQRLVNPFAAVLADNRRKARDSHRQIAETAGRGLLDRPDRGGPDSFFRVLPLYNQPSDVPAIRDQELRHQEFKPRLIHHIRRLVLANAHRERHLRENYDQLQRQWTRRLERLGNSAKRKQRDAKSRDYFEKYFPEVRKSREEKERMERFYAQPAARSEAEVNEMVDTIKNAREEEERMKSLAVLPPMLLPPWERRRLVANSNGLVRGDPVQLWNADQDLSFRWLPHERATFKEKFLLYGKNFGAIAAFLENKSVPDCVQFYYLTKKKEAYKQLYKKHNIRRRKVIEANRTGGGASSAAPRLLLPPPRQIPLSPFRMPTGPIRSRQSHRSPASRSRHLRLRLPCRRRHSSSSSSSRLSSKQNRRRIRHRRIGRRCGRPAPAASPPVRWLQQRLSIRHPLPPQPPLPRHLAATAVSAAG